MKMVKMKQAVAAALGVAFALGSLTFGNVEPLSVKAAEANEARSETLIPNDAIWKYHDQDTDLYAQNFFSTEFADSAWATGKQPLGYPAGDNNSTFGAVSSGTLVNSRKNPNAIITYYFRREFNVETLENLSALKATVGIDDGFVIYINGVEVQRTYMNEGKITHSTAANYVNEPSSAEGTVQLNLSSKIGLLKAGTNQIAVSAHNRDSNSSDIYFAMNLVAEYDPNAPSPEIENEALKPKQVNAHIGDEASTQINLSYTTIAPAETKVTYKAVGTDEIFTATGDSSQGAANKFFHGIRITDLTPDTRYEYTVGVGANTYSGKFKTAPAKGTKGTFKFAYLADTQVSNGTNAKALGATLAEVAKGDYDFVYLAGDHTDTSTNESQWENLFYNEGQFPTGGQDMYGNNTVAVIQGNHDNTTLQRHINAPAQAGNIVYSYDYGPATFVMINLETARSDATARERQAAFVRKTVADANKRGQWTVVGFHKSLYTGASHVTDSDVVAARKYWAPIFIELDIDLVLQGHDHVYSRGFVDANGANANPQKDASGKVIDPKQAAMWMVGGHAGGLKWYSPKNYSVGEGDPIAPGYSFLDVNSTNPNGDYRGSNVEKEQVIVEIEMGNTEYTVNTYMFKYDTGTDTITKEKYLFDTITVKRTDFRPETTASAKGSQAVAVEDSEGQLSYTVALENVDVTNSTNAAKFQVEYDPSKMELTSVDSLIANTVFKDVKDENGVVTVTLGTSSKIPVAAADIAKLNFKLKQPVAEGETKITLLSITTASYKNDGSSYEDTVMIPEVGKSVNTEIYSYATASDINGDSIITLADLSIALAYFQSNYKPCDVDRSGIVDTADYIIISGYIA